MTFAMTDEQLLALPLAYRSDLFKDQIVLVTGAGRGIGKAIAVQCARMGANVVIAGRKAEPLEAPASLLRRIGAEVVSMPMTIRDPDQVAALFDAAYARFGRIDHLVNNAGGQYPQAAIDFTPKGWNAVVDTNLNGTWYMMQTAARRWRDHQQNGSIVNIVAPYKRGMPGVAHTVAARGGVVALSITVAIEWAPLGIRVNCLVPGAIATEGMDVYPEDARRAMPYSNLMHRFGTVSDVANAVCYLTGPTGGFITGEVLTVDGGSQISGDIWTIPRPDYFKVPE